MHSYIHMNTQRYLLYICMYTHICTHIYVSMYLFIFLSEQNKF